MHTPSTTSTAPSGADRRARLTRLVLGYLALELALGLLYAVASVRAPDFIYQAF